MSKVNQGRIDPSNPPSATQSQTDSTHWFAYPSDVVGAGYFVDNDPNQAAKDAAARAKANDGVGPYEGVGLDAVILQAYPNNAKAREAVYANADANDVINKNALADPAFTTAVGKLTSVSVDQALAEANGEGTFGQKQLENAKARLDALS